MILIFNSCISIQRAWVCFMASLLSYHWVNILFVWSKPTKKHFPILSTLFKLLHNPHSHMENKLLFQDRWTNFLSLFLFCNFVCGNLIMVIHYRNLAIFKESCHILVTTWWNLSSKFDDFKTSFLKIWRQHWAIFFPKKILCISHNDFFLGCHDANFCPPKNSAQLNWYRSLSMKHKEIHIPCSRWWHIF